ncbi:MAG: septum formation family protein [Micrococcales bacterium]|nr:septum formation family protein [Micrococcales bacterium]
MHTNFLRTVLAGGAGLALAFSLGSCSLVDDIRADAEARAASQAAQKDEAKSSGSSVRQSALDPGDCIMWSDIDDSERKIPVMDCSEPHDAEVAGEYHSTKGSAHGIAFENEVNEKCGNIFDEFIGEDWESLGIAGGYIVTEGVGLVGTVTCVVVTEDIQPTLTQSLAGMG